jgi:hypothetical protein
MSLILTIGGQLLMLFTALWMLKTWQPKDGVPGWYAAAFCSGLLITSFAASSLLAHVIELTPMFWFKQLAFYAAFPLLSFVLLALSFKVDWPKEAWGRILLGVCGIYWLCQQTQNLSYLLTASALISSFAIARILLNKASGICMKQANLALSIVAFSSLILVLHSASSNMDVNPVAQDLAAQWPIELALGLLLAAINRTFVLRLKAQSVG